MNDLLLEYISQQPSFVITVIAFIGYIFASIQKLTRLTYYKVDNVYLFEIRMGEIFLGVIYLFILSLPVAINFTRHTFLLMIIGVVLYFLMTYALRLEVEIKRYIGLIFPYFIYLLFIWLDPLNCVEFFKVTVTQIFVYNAFFAIHLVLGIMMLIIVVLQLLAEASNDRFTYINPDNENEVYIIITRTEGTYITVRGKLKQEGDKVKIYIFRGNVKLIPIDNQQISVIFVDEKKLENESSF
ncbi:hypothetical protein [Phascolarctobacterium sp.]|uniref:hypothetical protein n=1 Tax=Phascolarctobacterium sp. TaxID=2049039 RepID=UPI003F7E066B